MSPTLDHCFQAFSLALHYFKEGIKKILMWPFEVLQFLAVPHRLQFLVLELCALAELLIYRSFPAV